jgi:hypothetical protein
MRKWVFVCLISLFFSQSVFAMTGREIMEKTDALPEPQTAKSKILMLIHKGGEVQEKEFLLQMKQFENDEDKALIEFVRPTQIKLLTHSHKKTDDDQWLTLSSGNVNRIVSSGRDKPFVNSHFYYEDLTSIDIDDYKYELLGDGTAVGEDCFKVEGVKQVGDRVYDKVIFYVRKSDYFVLRVDFFKGGEFHKFLENYEIKEIDGILTPYKMKMELSDGAGKTELILKGLKYNDEIDSAVFRKEAL